MNFSSIIGITMKLQSSKDDIGKEMNIKHFIFRTECSKRKTVHNN